jgi:hypothetical protein
MVYSGWKAGPEQYNPTELFAYAVSADNDNSQTVKEPCEANISSTVLKPSGGGNSVAYVNQVMCQSY